METLTFNGKDISYQAGWHDQSTFSLDAGYGEGLKDSDGDEYFIHIEYHADENVWVREVWFEDDYLSVKEWKDYDDKMKAEYDKIVELAKTLV